MDFEECYRCLWWECCACDGEPNPCEKFLPYGHPDYKTLADEYENDCQEALAVVSEKWQKIFNNR